MVMLTIFYGQLTNATSEKIQSIDRPAIPDMKWLPRLFDSHPVPDTYKGASFERTAPSRRGLRRRREHLWLG